MTRTVYDIRDMLGETIAEHVRVDLPWGKKQMSWRVPGCDPRDGLMGLSTVDLPLYGTERVPSFTIGQTVVVAEGEKATEAAWSLGIDALGIVTGAGATPGEDALSVLLPFDVVLWPDHDREGHQLMNRVAWGLHRLGGALPRAIVPDEALADGRRLYTILEKGFDAADFVSLGGGRARAAMLLLDAERWRIARPVAPPTHALRPVYDRQESDDRVQAARSHLAQVAVEKLGHPKKQDRRSMWWPCPFHADRSPSFKVDLTEPYYVCFGCGARGDVFTFLRAIEGVEFKDALQDLAPAVGLGGIPRLWG